LLLGDERGIKITDTDVEKGMAAGADDYVMKPFDPPKVVERVKEIFSH